MSKTKEMEGTEEESGELSKYLVGDQSSTSFGVSSHTSPPEKVRVLCETNPRIRGLSCHGIQSSKKLRLDVDGSGSVGSVPFKPKDADYRIPPLMDEVEALILARVPRSEYRKFCGASKRFLVLLKSGELYKIRTELGIKEPSVFVSHNGENTWREFDRQFKSGRKLPTLPSDSCFATGDRESLCVGTHLIVSGKEMEGIVVWRYDTEANQWSKGPCMIKPRCMFASASCGSYGYVAGGVTNASAWKPVNSAERYNAETKTWEPLPNMRRMRRDCSGCYLDNKFYVIGGKDWDGKYLNCAEAFDVEENTWELIPDLLEADGVQNPIFGHQSPPLIAVVANQLYSLETATNELKVYLKNRKSWKKLGTVPVRADATSGWGIAFKSLGDELVVIQSPSENFAGPAVPARIYTCCPDPAADELQWQALEHGHTRPTRFIVNCCVMVA